MRYAIQLSMYRYNSETDTEYEQWAYVGIEGEHRIFVLDDDVCKRTKLFKTAKEAGEYLDAKFSPEEQRCSYSSARIVEIKKGE